MAATGRAGYGRAQPYNPPHSPSRRHAPADDAPQSRLTVLCLPAYASEGTPVEAVGASYMNKCLANVTVRTSIG